MHFPSIQPKTMSFSSPEIILTSSPNGLITAHDTISGTTIARFSGSRSPRHGLAILGNSYIAASHISPTTASASIHLYNWWSSSALHHLPVPEPVAPLAPTPDGSFLFAGGLSGHVYTLSIISGNIVRSLQVHTKPVSCLVISADSSLLISGGDDGVIVTMPIYSLIEEPSHVVLEKNGFLAHDGPVVEISSCIGSCCPIIASCSIDCVCKLWSLLDGRILNIVEFPCPISGILFGKTEDVFYGGGSDGVIYKGWFGKELEVWNKRHGGPVVSVTLINEGKNLVSAAEDGSVFMWEIERGEVIRVLGDTMEGISHIQVAKGISDGNLGNGVEIRDGGSVGLSVKSRPVKVAVEIENVLTAAGKDRRKAIEMLESAIGVYESLMKLILKEAKNQSNENK